MKMKIRMHLKICTNPPESLDICNRLKVPRKPLTMEEQQIHLNEQNRILYKYYLSNWINITNSERNQEATRLQELTPALLIQKLSQAHLRGNTSRDYPGLQRFLSICKFSLTTPYQLLCISDHCVLHRVVIGTDTTHPQVIYLLQDSSLI